MCGAYSRAPPINFFVSDAALIRGRRLIEGGTYSSKYSNSRIPCHSIYEDPQRPDCRIPDAHLLFAPHWIRIETIAIYFVLRSTLTHVNEVVRYSAIGRLPATCNTIYADMLDFVRKSKQSPVTWKSLQEKSWLFYKRYISLRVPKVCLILFKSIHFGEVHFQPSLYELQTWCKIIVLFVA